VVYLAEEARPRRKVALKLLAPELAQRETFRQRFLREQELAASIDHPHVLPVYDAGEADGVLWLAMRYVDGMDLRALLAGKGPLPPAQALEIVTQVADALDAAHERGLVHRDVKPGNILLAPAGGGGAEHAYLADFGLTRRADDASELTGSGQVLGTVDYVAPEQVEGGSVDGRADQYALVCVLIECLTGVVPFRRSTELAVLWAHVHHQPPRLGELRSGLPAALDGVLARGLAKAPADRYPTCASLATAARDALDPGGTAAAASAAPPRGPAVRRLLPALVRRAGRLLPVVALVALAGATTIAGLLLRLPIVTPDTAVRIDAASGNVVATVKVGATPSAVAVGGGLSGWPTPATRPCRRSIRPPTGSRARSTYRGPLRPGKVGWA
jgi:tRNA A-37 threonylcarbamoyl transferase component Bud32